MVMLSPVGVVAVVVAFVTVPVVVVTVALFVPVVTVVVVDVGFLLFKASNSLSSSSSAVLVL